MIDPATLHRPVRCESDRRRGREPQPGHTRASTDPGASGAPGAGAAQQPGARDELWVVIVLIVLFVLLAEWLVYHRDAVTRLWRGIRRAPSASTLGTSSGTSSGRNH